MQIFLGNTSNSVRHGVEEERQVIVLGRDKLMDASSTEEFVRVYSKSQHRIMRFIQCLVPNYSEAEDVLQETSTILWRKWPEFQRDKDFVKWACGIARLEVFRMLRQNKKSGQYLNEDVLKQVAEAALAEAVDIDRFAAGETALKNCIQELAQTEKRVLTLRYHHEKTIVEIAEECKRPKSSIHDLLAKIRARLVRCVRRRLET
jgi:RNA polymerase sigma-70 factor (ECF subfamily)